jgi:hypothetical protein
LSFTSGVLPTKFSRVLYMKKELRKTVLDYGIRLSK